MHKFFLRLAADVHSMRDIFKGRIAGILMFGALAVTWASWHFSVPAPGKAVTVMGIAAALMALRGELRPLEKAAWTILLVAFLVLEFEAIDADRAKHDEEQRQGLADARAKFAAILRNQQAGFAETLKELVGSQREERNHFASVIGQGTKLFAHQQELAEGLTETLTAASDEMPTTICTKDMDKDDLLILVGTNAYVTHRFPHTILEIGNNRVLAIDRTADKKIDIIADIRGPDGKLMARLGGGKIVVNRNNILAVRKEPNSIVIEDQYGREVLNARYLNQRSFRIDGLLYYGGHPVQLSQPISPSVLTGSCMMHSNVDIHLQ
jgi:hypothetical protein